MRLKEVYVSARDPYERGLQHGSQASEEIRRGCIEYRPAFEKKGYTWDEARELAMKFVPYLQQSMPDLMEEAKGIALADPYLYLGGRTVGGREKRGGNNAGGGGILL